MLQKILLVLTTKGKSYWYIAYYLRIVLGAQQNRRIRLRVLTCPEICGYCLGYDEALQYVYELESLSVNEIPSCIGKVLESKACRGAIMFGDILTLEECKNVVEKLADCNLPFQCAHGRPTMTVLLKC
jgi:DNA mismatch repair ATPase MutL